jgi:hypothetical protein
MRAQGLLPGRLPHTNRRAGQGRGSASRALPGGGGATCLKVTGPDGKDFTLHFDEESGLLVKQVTQKYPGTTLVTVNRNYKDFRGIKVATRVVTRWDFPEKPQFEPQTEITELEMTEFRVLDKVDPNTFAKPREDDDHLLRRRLEGP